MQTNRIPGETKTIVMIRITLATGKISARVIIIEAGKEKIVKNSNTAIKITTDPIIFNNSFKIICPDLNPLRDEGSLTSTGSIHPALALWDVIGFSFNAESPRRVYHCGWSYDGLLAPPIVCTWTLSRHDVNGRLTHLSFDLADEKLPLILDLGLQRYS